MKIIKSIQNRIYDVRGERVMLDFDLAPLFEVSTKVLNQSVKRNLKRFPRDFIFRLTKSEWEEMRSQIVTASQNRRNTKATPYAFTEQGVSMLSGVLKSDRAIKMHIAIVRTFIAMRKAFVKDDLREQVRLLKEKLGEHDSQLSHIYDAIENLLDERAAQRKWEDRERIGFKRSK
ncbi:MAG TPA: ORF6N domain-containing protein [Chitinophagaceae bacterium]